MKFWDKSIVPIHLFPVMTTNFWWPIYYIPSVKSNIIGLGQMTEEGSIMELVGSFLKFFDKNGARLIKIKLSRNHLSKVLMKHH